MRLTFSLYTAAKITLVIFYLILLPCGPSYSQELDWQTSRGVNTELSIRDKYGVLGGYEAIFIVKEGKNHWQKKINVKGSDEGIVQFPNDFDPYLPPGKYHWQCFVQGKEKLSGNIDYRSEPDGRMTISVTMPIISKDANYIRRPKNQ